MLHCINGNPELEARGCARQLVPVTAVRLLENQQAS